MLFYTISVPHSGTHKSLHFLRLPQYIQLPALLCVTVKKLFVNYRISHTLLNSTIRPYNFGESVH